MDLDKFHGQEGKGERWNCSATDWEFLKKTKYMIQKKVED